MKKCITIFFAGLILSTGFIFSQRKMENLGRGVVAVRTGSSSVFISWRLLGLDPSGIGFNVYRSTAGGTAVKLNSSVLTAGTNYTDNSANLTQTNAYFVKPVISGVEQTASGSFTLSANHATEPCFRVPVRNTGDIQHVWVGDLDGDGEYDFVVARLSVPQKVEAYRRDGTFLWATDQGPNSDNTNNTEYEARPSTLCSGNWDGVTVYDMDGDGKAEVMVRTANGVVFGDGQRLTVSNNDAQFISVLNGMTGAEKARIEWPTDYASDGIMSQNFGIGYLNGQTPSLIVKGKNRVGTGAFNMMVCAFSFNGSSHLLQWKWKRGSTDAPDGHQFRMNDVDSNGTDEFNDIGFSLNSNGTFRYKLSGVVHGDRFHIGKFDPNRSGLQGFGVQQNNPSGLQYFLFDASSGNIYRQHLFGVADVGRGVIADIDPNYPGCEYWAFNGTHRIDNGTMYTTERLYPNFALWWDGDVLREHLTETNVNKWDYANLTKPRILNAASYGAVDETRDAPTFLGDIYGDWREEIIFTNSSTTELIIFTTPTPSSTRIYTLAHNPMYRNSMTMKGYMQQHNLDYFLGNGMGTPPAPNIVYVGGSSGGTETKTYQAENYTSMSGIAVSTQYSGFTGTGFADYGGNGTWLEWNNVTSAKAGSASLVFRYANGHSSGANRQCAVTANGVSAGNVAFASTGSWNNWGTVSMQVTLNSGTNTIRVTANTSNGGPNLDKMDVTSLKSAQETGVAKTADFGNQDNNDVFISPNPLLSGNYLNLKLYLGSESEIKVFIYDISGKAVFNKNLGVAGKGSIDKVIDLGLLPKGIYILTVKTNLNMVSKKFIKD